MYSRNMITVLYLAASLTSAIALAKDEGFRYHESTGQCLNLKGEMGFNGGYFGECGDINAIRLFRQKKIDKADLKYANLKGIQINGLDFSNKDLTGANLTGANLIATDLSHASLSDTKLEKAKFNDVTQLPFTIEEAANRAMINIDFIGDRPVDDTILSDILTATNPATLEQALSEIRRPQQTYHSRLQAVFNSAKKLTAAQLQAFMQAAFAQQERVNQLFDLIQDNQNSEEPDSELAEQLQKEIRLHLDWAHNANNILYDGVLNKLKLEELSKIVALQICSNAIPFNATSTTDSIFSLLLQKHNFSDSESLAEFIKAAIASGAVNNATTQTIRLLELRGEVSVETILASAEEFYSKRDHAIGLLFSTGITKLDVLEFDHLITFIEKSKNSKNEIIKSGISKLRTLKTDQAIKLLAVADYSTKDAILTKFFSLNSSVSYENFVALVGHAYQTRNELLTSHINDVEELTPEQASHLVSLASYAGKDSVANAYLSALDKKITSNQLLSIAKNSYQQRNDILKTYLNRVSDLSATNVALLAHSANYSGKDQVIKEYLSAFTPRLSTRELISLAGASYQAGNEVLTNNMSLLSDLSVENTVVLASSASYSAKDTLIKNYLNNFSKGISATDLIKLARAAYQEGTNILMANLPQVSPFDLNASLTLVEAISYSNKNVIIKKYIDSQTTISTKDLITLARVSYNLGAEVITTNLPKLSDLDLANTLFLADVLTYSNKNVVIQLYISSQSQLTSKDLLTLAQKSYNIGVEIITANLTKLSDLNQDNTLMLASALTYNYKNVVLSFYLNKSNSITTDQLIAVANASYQKQAEYINNSLAKVSDLKVANALRLKSAFSYASLDAYLLHALEEVSDLNQSNLMTMANSAYQAKDRIFARGMEILLSRQ